ncbi:MotA/TolQ/ExbB proton channel family protein [Paenirhodobacter hankyongi]|uniref:Methyl-accepting chemotaxis protein n=1 Tax=Paenirhodobacter hankyongi TaxID=2294033 RepID=A0A421BXJ8_9RHOB|nr:MotA/TolQ/ExbB proton channel family protein [Sinirhodobacter hankyongi]RLL73041.1 methyl-accepting chemotaxis protein [Sinirhodobacter hankyongi]
MPTAFQTIFDSIGLPVVHAVLFIAAALKNESAPGLVVILLVLGLLGFSFFTWRIMRHRAKLLQRVNKALVGISPEEFAQGGRERFSAELHEIAKGNTGATLREAWDEFSETTIVDDLTEPPVLRNTVRPATFFNLDDLGYGPGFLRLLPGLFVSIGLALTFLGLIAALHSMSGEEITSATMQTLLRIASAKFIMSLTGLACSIVFTIVLHRQRGKVEKALHQLVRLIEEKLTFASLEQIALNQLKAQVEAQEAQRKLGFELVAELGRPLREEVPQAIAQSISDSMQPILDRVGQQGTDSVQTMAADLSQQVSSGVEQALTIASERIAQAGDRIAQLASRMDESSGRMGSEMDQAVARVAQAVEDLRNSMTQTAQSASGAFTAGAEQLLGVMNTTLEGIRDNTGAGARAMSEAASDMSKAAQAMREEMEGAAKSGAEAAQARMQEAGTAAGAAIDGAGRSMLSAFEASSQKITEMSHEVFAKAGQELMSPLTTLGEQLDDLVSSLEDSTEAARATATSLRDGAQATSEAAGRFRTASQDMTAAAQPIRASTEQVEAGLRNLNESTRNVATTVTRSAEITAQSAAQALKSAQEILGTQRQAIEAAMRGVEELVRRMQGQGDKLDDIDNKLGHAFDIYASQTETAMQSVRGHVVDMSKGLNDAVSVLQTVVDNLQDFQPQQRGA